MIPRRVFQAARFVWLASIGTVLVVLLTVLYARYVEAAESEEYVLVQKKLWDQIVPILRHCGGVRI